MAYDIDDDHDYDDDYDDGDEVRTQIRLSKNHPQPCGIFYFLTHSARFKACYLNNESTTIIFWNSSEKSFLFTSLAEIKTKWMAFDVCISWINRDFLF